ncbi:MAG: hypothetical protein R2867_42990 [Caldilineaceae bacterium]
MTDAQTSNEVGLSATEIAALDNAEVEIAHSRCVSEKLTRSTNDSLQVNNPIASNRRDTVAIL